MTDLTKTCGALHKVYEDVSGLPVPLTLQRTFAWEAWMAKGWTEADLRLVMAHLKNRSKSAPIWAKMNMMFTRFIADTNCFEELLSEARALSRVKHVEPGKAQLLRATNRPSEPPTGTAKSAEAVMRGDEELKKLLALRDSL